MRRRLKCLLALLACVYVASSVPVQAFAQQPSPAGQAAPQDPQDQFVPVKTLPAQETLPAAPLVMTAYAFVWAVLLVYVWTVWRRLMKVEREIHDLSARIGEKR
jgi:CcmD family protein